MKWIVVLVLIWASTLSLGQRIPPPSQSFLNNLNNAQQNQSAAGGGGLATMSMQAIQQQQKNEEIANIKDETIKRVLTELASLQTPSQMSDTMSRVADLVAPLFVKNFETRKDEINQNPSGFPQRLLSAVTDIQGEETKASVLEKKLDNLHAQAFAFLPLAIQYGLQEEILSALTGAKLASLVKINPGDTVVADKMASALVNKSEDQIEFLQSLGTKLLPQVQRIIMTRLLEWWKDPHEWKDRELNLLTTSGSPLLAYLPQSQLQSLDDELADRFVTTLGQTPDIARSWWRKPMSLKKAWFELAKGARYFGAVHEWSFRRMQKLSFLLEGASPEDLELIPPVPEIKGLVIGNHYTELQARVVFDAFYHTPPLSQEDLQEFQFHVLDLTPAQLQRFDFADSFGTLDEMLSILERQKDPSYPTALQISYFMWPIVNTTNSISTIAPPSTWQKRELAQIGRMFFLLPKSVLSQIKQGVINWDSTSLTAIRSNHFTQYQTWKITSQILLTVEDRFKPDYIFMTPSPFQQGIPSVNISQVLLGSPTVRPEVLRALIEQASGMLTSQKAVILQRISHRIAEPIIIRTMISTANPAEMFKLISPKTLAKNMGTIIKTIMEMPETGKFGITSILAKLLPQNMLSLWLKWVRENSQVTRWTAEDLLGRSPMGGMNELNLAILGLSCRDVEIIDPWDILSAIMHYRHELYALRRFKSSLKFNVNLRSCMMEKVVEYLIQKRFLNGNETDEHVLAGITVGETEAIGGEILSTIPPHIMEELEIGARQNIIKEIGQLQMQEMFSLASLETLHLYAQTLFRDIVINSSPGLDDSSQRRRRQAPGGDVQGTVDAANNATATQTNSTNANDAPEATQTTELDSKTDGAASPDTTDPSSVSPNATATSGIRDTSAEPLPLPKHEIDIEALNSMGNLLCYADNIFDANWPRSLLKDVLETKTSIGEKTCCLTKSIRNKWFETLKAVYGSDTSSWNEFDLSAIGDLLIVLPDKDLQKISTDALGKAVTPMMRQSAWAVKLCIPGGIKEIQFVTACVEALGTEGAEFMATYKTLMKRIFQASQWMINTVKTTQELIRDGVGRTGRIPRWAEHSLSKRQVPITMTGGELTYSGASPAVAPGTTVIYTQAPQGYSVQPQQFMTASYPTQYGSPMMQMQQPVYTQMYTSQIPGQQSTQMFTPQFMPTTFVQQPIGQVGISGSAAGAATVATGGTGIAGAASGGAGIGGGSFSAAGAATQTGANNANAFGQGGSFTQGSDLTQQGGGSFGQSNANVNALAARSTAEQQQQQQQQQASPPMQSQNANSNAPAQPPQPPSPSQGALLTSNGQPQSGNQPGLPPSGTPPGVPPPGQPQPQSGNQPQPGLPQSGNPPTVLQSGQPSSGNAPVLQQPNLGPGQQPGGNQQGTQQPAPGAPVNIANNPLGPNNQDLRTRSLNFGALQDETHNSEITCHGIKAAGPAAIGLTSEDLSKLSQADLFDCVEALGRIEWDEDTKGQIMTLLKQKLQFNQDSINTFTLIELGDLVTVFSANPDGLAVNTSSNATIHSDVSIIDLTLPDSLDVLSILGTRVINPALLKALAEKFNQDNRIFPGQAAGISRPENLRIVVMSLGNIVCGFNDKIVNSIFETDPSLLVDTSSVLGKLEGCGNEVLSTLANFAVRPANFGPPRLWTQEDVETIGVVFAGMKSDAISTVPAEAMQGLTPMAIKSLPTTSISAFREDQLSKMSYSAAVAFSPSQTNMFSPAQAEVIKAVLHVKPELFNIAPEVEPPATPTQTTDGAPPQEETFNTRDLENQTDPGIGGRSRDSPTQTTTTLAPEVRTHDDHAEDPNAPPESDTPSSSPSSSSRIQSVWRFNGVVTLLALVIPVIQFLIS